MTEMAIESVSYSNLHLYINIFNYLLGMVGTAFIFKKCGQEWWKALIPAYSDYALGQCADREMEGRIIFLLQAAVVVFSFGAVLTEGTVSSLLSLLQFFASIVGVVFSVRVFIGLLENYDKSKWWIAGFLLIPAVVMLIFGLSRKFNPRWKISDFEAEEKNFFQKPVSVLDSGLTVNLKKRTTMDFLKRSTLLEDIHLNIKPGSMVLLLGGSGCGKTTFINAVNGYEKADAEIMLDGRNVYKEYDSMKYEIGYVPQLDLMRGSDTVLRTLADAAALRLPQNFSWSERRARVDEVMDIFGLTPVQNSLVEKLSGGQRKRLSIAMEFLANPTLFILDEPDSGLDGVMARELMQQLRSIADQGKIVIVITHTPDRVIDLFDHVIVLAKDSRRIGRLAFYGTVDEAKEFFERDSMEKIVKTVNRPEEGGDGRADELIQKYSEVTSHA